MHLMRIRASAAHGLFHAMQRVDTLLKELELLDLHRLSTGVVNECFTHGRGVQAACRADEVEGVIQFILGELPERVKTLPPLTPWQERYREGLIMELVAKLHQALGLVGAYRTLLEALDSDPPLVLHTAEGVIDREDWFSRIERACNWEPGTGPWG